MGVVSAVVTNASVVPGSGLSLQDGWKYATWTFSNSYTTNGEALSVPGFTTIDAVLITGGATASTAAASVFGWDPVNNKIKAYVGSTGVEVANTTNLSTITLNLLVFGR